MEGQGKRGVEKRGGRASTIRQGCNGRALDRVTKQQHRPNRQISSKKCPKIVFSAPLDNFSTFFEHLVDIPIFWAVKRFARYNARGGVGLRVGGLTKR